MSNYNVSLSVHIETLDNGSRFSIFENQRVELSSFTELDALLARMRDAVHPNEEPDTSGPCSREYIDE